MEFWVPLLLALQESLFGFQETFVYLDKKERHSKIKLSKIIFSETLLHSLVKNKSQTQNKNQTVLGTSFEIKSKNFNFLLSPLFKTAMHCLNYILQL